MPEVQKKVVMVRAVARRWISRVAHVEYRFSVLLGAKELRNLPNLLRSFRDGRVAMEGVTPIQDLGVRNNGDSIEVWSQNRTALIHLKDWFEKRDFETTGVW